MLRQVVAEERHPALVAHVERVDEPAAFLRDHVAHLAEDRVDAGGVDRQGLRAELELQGRGVLARDPAELLRRWPGAGAMSLSSRRILRPLPSPSNGIDVSDGQAMTMPLPRPAEFFSSWWWKPSPKASSRLTGDRAPDDPERGQEACAASGPADPGGAACRRSARTRSIASRSWPLYPKISRGGR